MDKTQKLMLGVAAAAAADAERSRQVASAR